MTGRVRGHAGVLRARLGAAALLWLLLAGCVAQSPERIFPAPHVIDVPLGQPLRARINGQGPYRLGLDTGQSLALLVTPTLAHKLELPVVQRASASDGTAHNNQTVNVVQVNRLAIDESAYRDVLAVVIDNSLSGEDVVGAVGFPLFARQLLTLDFPSGRLYAAPGILLVVVNVKQPVRPELRMKRQPQQSLRVGVVGFAVHDVQKFLRVRAVAALAHDENAPRLFQNEKAV